jgi:hypothetical protein
MMRSTFRPGDLAGVLGRLALGVVEVGRDGDDRAVDLLAEVVLGGLLEVLEDERGDLLGRELALVHLHLDELVLAPPVIGRDLARAPAVLAPETSAWRRPMNRLIEKTCSWGW